MKIDGFDTDQKVLIIAEIGNNHEGNFDLAKEMIAAAAKAGAHAVKFQTFRPEHYVSQADTVRFERLKKFSFSEEQFKQLSECANKHGVMFVSTPFDLHSAQFLNAIVPVFKVSSSDNTFYPLLEKIAHFNKPVIISSGLTDLDEITNTKTFIEQIWKRNNFTQELAILHCVASYPVPENEINLASIRKLREHLNCTIGYSDHALGIEAAVLSVAMGARIIEKHFTLDKNYSDFRDHQLSADPNELKQMVSRIKQAEVMLGQNEVLIGECEKSSLNALRRSIIATRELQVGELVKVDDISWVRPGGGIPPGQENLILGKKVIKTIGSGEQITEKHLN